MVNLVLLETDSAMENSEKMVTLRRELGTSGISIYSLPSPPCFREFRTVYVTRRSFRSSHSILVGSYRSLPARISQGFHRTGQSPHYSLRANFFG